MESFDGHLEVIDDLHQDRDLQPDAATHDARSMIAHRSLHVSRSART
jgi:hypothetical protein